MSKKTNYASVLRIIEKLSGRKATIILVALALLFGIVTFVILSGGIVTSHKHHIQLIITLLNLSVLLLLVTALFIRIMRLIVERRKGMAGSKIHVKLVVLFGIISIIPTILVGVFATVLFHYGIQIWFSNRVSTALNEALQASRGYLQEHNANIRTEAFSLANYIQGMQNNLAQEGQNLFEDSNVLDQILDSQATLRGLNAAIVYNPATQKIVASGGLLNNVSYIKNLPRTTTSFMSHNDVAILDSSDKETVRAAISISDTPSLMLLIIRPVDPTILNHMYKTEKVVDQYNVLNSKQSQIQIMFVIIFGLVALLVLAAAVLLGLYLANQIARPVGLLTLAAKKVSEGDLNVSVPERDKDDELTDLSRTFNKMTNQLSVQRTELIEANKQIDDRRRFTEAVLFGVSSGVIGLDKQMTIELPNRSANQLLNVDLFNHIGQKITDIVPEFTEFLLKNADRAQQSKQEEIQIQTPSGSRVLLVQIGPEIGGSEIEGFVITFDDITELQSAQRKAAWADIARRIAHEIKNPLTPIQLAAERLKRRFLKEIQSDSQIFSQCIDTIVRHVGDIGRMVDEFSSFARMPQPVMSKNNLSTIVRDTLILQQNAHSEIKYHIELPNQGPYLDCDQRLIGQALTNLFQNAADAISMLNKCDNIETAIAGNIWVQVKETEREICIFVTDDGIGLPQEDRLRLTEPYVTHKPKGTGLGLAIVKKIMEDHKGTLQLRDRAEGKGTTSILAFQR
ncbi:Signal transduction histidine kinase NtrY involved in nitrogen fixation and metabolism regulation (NtrY) [Commensalibacter communis]|uniref:histidine kinase n=1 Tax=Commensalibacter communis TaxID=2972786 RepID=A0A9W4XHD8_9PROT|nr:PAS domain-containing sensor histidine kinase [Commensalibacter communis]CAI3927665.1 Signal transduction histidine kinase NtrY involved in nitrogen fixation and metabolism regulation (NtrY) [Commensalibacter communis]CAI3928228.1 Signal transduction histidine kinase NtrY involved in nitrogen fixation and metabolism regulation (NtrY) [Commensalibacter communis]CAI3933221.1 Signal transduction histidine kinase NtrY involved in nitrogen fixation and metabolism regulation (NtrY) [Commensalibacte